MNTIFVSFRTLEGSCVRNIVEQDVHDAVADWILSGDTAHVDKNVCFVITSKLEEAYDLSERITGERIVVLISRRVVAVSADIIITAPEYVGQVITRELQKLSPKRV